MTKEEIIESIQDSKVIYVMHYNKVPHYVSMNPITKEKIGFLNTVDTLTVIIDETLKDDEVKLLR